jgi:hypothetical protein
VVGGKTQLKKRIAFRILDKKEKLQQVFWENFEKVDFVRHQLLFVSMKKMWN